MTSLASREATTTAAAAGAADCFQHSEFILFKQILQRIDGPAARHSVCSVYSVDSKILIFRVFRAFRGFSSMVWLRPKAAPSPFVFFRGSLNNR